MKLYKKIDFYYNGDYYMSTMRSKTCKEAKKKLLDNLKDRFHSYPGLTLLQKQILKNPHLLKAKFEKR